MVTNAEIKNRARETLGYKFASSKWISGVLVTVIYLLISGVISYASRFVQYLQIELLTDFVGLISSILSLFIIAPLGFGLYRFFLELGRGKNNNVGILFSEFQYGYWDSVSFQFTQGLYLSLWTMLFIIPGIIKTYSYSMAIYIKLDHPTMSANEAITESRRLMHGNKWRLFCLDLSFIGWHLLSILTLGILQLWISPYVEAARVEFYLDLIGEKKEKDEDGEEEPPVPFVDFVDEEVEEVKKMEEVEEVENVEDVKDVNDE